MVDVKAEFLKAELELDRLSGLINDESSLTRFVERCDDVVRRLQLFFAEGYAPMGVKFCLEAQMYRIIYKKLSVLERDSNLAVAFQATQSLFRSRVRTGLVANLRNVDANIFLDASEKVICDFVEKSLKELKNIKVNVTFYGDFELAEKIEEKQFSVKYTEIFRTTNLSRWFAHTKEEILAAIDDFEVQRESGWAFKQAKFISINVVKYSPLSAGSYLDVPKWVSKTGGVINIQTDENDCFELCLLAHLEIPHMRNLHLPCRYAKIKGKKYDFTGTSNPIKLNQIPVFEKRNKISINVLFIDQDDDGNDVIATAHLCKKLYRKHVNLLMLTSENGNNHFCLIKDLSSLLRRFSPNKDRKRYYCDRCLHFFYKEAKMLVHKEACKKVFNCAIALPSKGKDELKFKNHRRQLKVPFVIYADSESILSKDVGENICSNAYRRHEIFSLGYYLKSNYDDNLSKYNFYRGPQSGSWFAQQLIEIAEQVQQVSF